MRNGTIKDSNTLTVILPAEPLPLPVEPAPPLAPPSIWSRRPMSCCSEIFCRTCPDCAMRMSKSCTAVALDGFTRAIRETTNDFSLLHSTLETHTSLTGIRIKDRAECLSLHLVLCLCFLSLLWLIVSRRRRSSWHGFRRTIASCSPSLLQFCHSGFANCFQLGVAHCVCFQWCWEDNRKGVCVPFSRGLFLSFSLRVSSQSKPVLVLVV